MTRIRTGVRVKPRRATTAEWAATQNHLAVNELGIDTDTGEMALGDGETAFASLPKLGGGGGGGGSWGSITGTLSAQTDLQTALDARLDIDGSTAMTGALDMGAQAITNVGNVDGRDVSVDGTKLDGIESGATADQSDAEIEAAYANEVPQVSTGERTAGTETALRTYSPADIASMAGTHGGSTVYASFSAPQLFNPDSAGVTANTDIFTLSGEEQVGLVSLNGQVLDDSEYSLSGADLTVTPDNGFKATTDEVLVFQQTFTGTGEFIVNAGSAPSLTAGRAALWQADASGTKDSTSYDEGDVLITAVNAAGTSKTLLVLDHSAL